jgi:hypothetical protein
MGLFDKLRRISRRRPDLSDREKLHNLLIREATYSTALAGFLTHAVNHGHGVRITVQVDGEQCGVAILAHAKEPLVVYLAEWACSQKLVKCERLAEFDRQGGGGAERIPEVNALGAKSGDQRWNEENYSRDMGL